MNRLIIIDDDDAMRETTAALLQREGYTVQAAADGDSGLQLLVAAQGAILLTDLKLPGFDGVELVRRARGAYGTQDIVVMTGYPDDQAIEELDCLGVHAVLVKPFSPEQLRFTLHGIRCRRREREAWRAFGAAEQGLVGTSVAMRRVREQVRRYAPTTLPVLIGGPTGTGKELVARALHALSARAGDFIPVNCALLGTLADSQLFGHAAGAYTGAVKAGEGFFRAADGGTLFLDEIGELPAEAQGKLLRALDSGEYTPVGDTKPRRADVRIIAATNRDLERDTEQGRFRPDLLYRIRGMHIMLTPLAQRQEDVPHLIFHFLEQQAHNGSPACRLLPGALALLQSYAWPGNVRELRHAVNALAQFAANGVIDEVLVHQALPHAVLPLQTYAEEKSQVLARFDRDYFARLQAAAGGSLCTALRLSGLHKKNYYTKLKTVSSTAPLK